MCQIRPHFSTFAKERMTHRADASENLAAARQIAGAGIEVVVEPAHFGEFFFGSTGSEAAPMLANELVEFFVLMQRHDAKLFDGEISGWQVSSINRAQNAQCPRPAAQQHLTDTGANAGNEPGVRLQ